MCYYKIILFTVIAAEMVTVVGIGIQSTRGYSGPVKSTRGYFGTDTKYPRVLWIRVLVGDVTWFFAT